MSMRWFVIACAGWALPCAIPDTTAGAPRAEPVVEVRQQLPAEIEGDSPIPVEVFVRNAGGAAAENVTLTESLPPGFELAESEPRPQAADGKLCWSVGHLNPGQEWALRLRLRRARGADPDRLSQAVEVAYQGHVRAVSETRFRRPALTLEVHGPDSPPVGVPTRFKIKVVNRGDAPARDVTLFTGLPDGLEHEAGKELELALGALGPGESRDVELPVTPRRTEPLQAELRVEGPGGRLAEGLLRCRAEPPKVTVATNAPAAFEANHATLFELVVCNEGPQAVGRVELALSLPKEVNFVRATDQGEYDARSHAVRWGLGSMAPGAKRSVVWNGSARSPGEFTTRAVLRTEFGEGREASCVLRVAPPAIATEPIGRR